jgi:phosphoribosylanthranilate isomerase
MFLLTISGLLDSLQCFPLEFCQFHNSIPTGAALFSQEDIRIKVCGITTVEDANLVAQAGADYIGVIIGADFSPRCLSVEQARPICEQSTLPVVTLLFNYEAEQIQRTITELHPHAVQLLGQETPLLVKELKKMADCELWKSIHLPPHGVEGVNIDAYRDRMHSLVDAGIDAIVIDTAVGSSQENRRYGGTGQVNNWAITRKLVEVIPIRTFLAGGITPENVQQAIRRVRPYGIDLCSGVEVTIGQKDPEKLRRLVLATRKSFPQGCRPSA